MTGARSTRLAALGITTLVGMALVLAGCGDADDGRDGAPTEPAPSSQGSGGVSVSSVAPNTFLTFEGRRYRLVDLTQANLVDKGGFEKIGAAAEADIDQDDLTVYKKAEDSEAVYTYGGEARPESAAVQPAEGEDASTPALWYRWVPEP